MSNPEQIECPFGIDARFCRHQETYARDILSAVKGDLIFICRLSKLEDCPRFEELKALRKEVGLDG